MAIIQRWAVFELQTVGTHYVMRRVDSAPTEEHAKRVVSRLLDPASGRPGPFYIVKEWVSAEDI